MPLDEATSRNQLQKKFVGRLKIAQTFSKSWAFKMVLRYFFTPLRFSTPEREEAFKHSSIISRELVNGKNITIYHVGSGEKKVLLVHGWSGRATQYYAMAPSIAKTGLKVFAFTAQAHGSSVDKETDILEFVESIKYIDKEYGPFEAIIGHSIGGTAVLNAINQGINTKKVVLLGVPGYFKDIVANFSKKMGLNSKTELKLWNYLQSRFGGDIEAYSTTQLAKKMSIPALIIHDVDDRDVAIEFARQNHNAWKGSKLIETNGLGHQLILSDSNVITKIKEFILH